MFNLLDNVPIKKRLLFYELEKFLHDVDSPPITLVAGMRKTGKTTLFAQIANKYHEQETILYINFRDEQVYSSRKDWISDDTAEDTLIYFLNKPDHSILLLDEITYLNNYETLAVRVHDKSCYKAIMTGSSPFHIKALHSGALGGGRSRLLHLPVLKFIEYLHLTTDHISYQDYTEVSISDFDNYLELKSLPNTMLRTFDEAYFISYYEEIDYSDAMTCNREGNSKLSSDDLMAFVYVLAYQLANRIGYKDLMNPNVGKNELPPFKKKGQALPNLGASLLELSKSTLARRSRKFGQGGVALLLKFLLRSFVVNAETELNDEEDSEMSIGRILKSLNQETTQRDLTMLLDKISFSVNSPLLYTRLSDDILRKAGFSWSDFSKLELNDRNALYGSLLEVYIRGGISELDFNSLPFTTAKLRVENNHEIDVVSFRCALLCETTVSNKRHKNINLGGYYTNEKFIRVCSTRDAKGTHTCYYQIPYPLLCCMIDTGDILRLQGTCTEDILDYDFDKLFEDIRNQQPVYTSYITGQSSFSMFNSDWGFPKSDAMSSID